MPSHKIVIVRHQINWPSGRDLDGFVIEIQTAEGHPIMRSCDSYPNWDAALETAERIFDVHGTFTAMMGKFRPEVTADESEFVPDERE